MATSNSGFPQRAYGHDRRRRPTIDERRFIYERAEGRCHTCGNDLEIDWHNSHMAAWINGGGTTIENVTAECAHCNLVRGSTDADLNGIELRDWQAKALPALLDRLWKAGVATLHAAPGAGKTLLAGAMFQALHEAGLVERMLVVVPNKALVEQWRNSLANMRIHLDVQPRDGVFEYPDTVGAIVTYHGLPGSARAHAVRLDNVPTLVVLDEVHHIADQASWGNAVRTMLGDVAKGEVTAQAVLNMTGTLFRSNKSKRISTVSYELVEADGGEQYQAIADWSISTADLIGKELRPPDLYAFSSHAEVVDVHEGTLISGGIADLGVGERKAVMREMYKEKDWLRGYVSEALRMLRNAEHALGDSTPLKLLYVASDQKAARMAADMINEVVGRNFARLIISDQPGALKELKSAVRDPKPCAIVAVQMVTEGFDCPEVAVIAYASRITAPLFVAQTMARAMRITKAERAKGRTLPAQILIPDNPELRAAFASALLSALHQVSDDEETDPTQRGSDGTPRLPRFQLLSLSDPILDSATVLGHPNGVVTADELARAMPDLASLGIPEPYAPRVIKFARDHVPPLPRYATEQPQEPSPSTVTTLIDPRAVNVSIRSRLKKAAGWMQAHIDHDDAFADIRQFQALANDAAHIPRGERDHASAEELEDCLYWMCDRIADHCRRYEEEVPEWAQ